MVKDCADEASFVHSVDELLAQPSGNQAALSKITKEAAEKDYGMRRGVSRRN
jgi:hypothetical protein